jgi:hypothetical protein
VIIYANLDQEAEWAGHPLPVRVKRRISAAAALLGALVPHGEAEIWAPAEVEATRLRRPVVMKVGRPPRWDLAWAEPAAKAANDRRLAHAVEAELGAAVAGACAFAMAEGALDALAAHASRLGRWVAKAAWTAAGRDRVIGDGAPTGEQMTYLGRMLGRVGAIVVEPWLERMFDLGVCVWPDGEVAPAHTLLVDARGGFVGIDAAPPPLTDGEQAQLARAIDATRQALARVAYRGPFTIDAFVYREGGERKLRPVCEINARYSFGHVARALGARTLGFGPAPAGAEILVDAIPDDPFSAWILPGA